MALDDTSDARPSSTTLRRYRTVFISDVHLGSRGCKADCLLDFLHHVESDYLYLVGDIVDGWRLRKRWFWPEKHNEILHKLLARAREGTRVVYLPGNHDEALRGWIGRSFDGVRILHDVVHHTADRRRLLVIRGDAFDGVIADMRWLVRLGSMAYDLALLINTGVNRVRRRLGLDYWPISQFLKDRVKAAVNFIDDFERSLAAEARRRVVCGVVCGHVHKPEFLSRTELARAAAQALAIPRARCRAYATGFSWRARAEQFLANLQPVSTVSASTVPLAPAAE